MSEVKLCSGCGNSKPRAEFHAHSNRADGLQVYCKDCEKERKNRPQARARSVAYFAEYDRRRSTDPARRRRKAEHKAEYNSRPDVKRRQLKRNLARHGLSVELYEAMLDDQGHTCAMPGCGKTEPGGTGRWHIDHDHSCCNGAYSCSKCVRGLLCFSCNTGLGTYEKHRGRYESYLRMAIPPDTLLHN